MNLAASLPTEDVLRQAIDGFRDQHNSSISEVKALSWPSGSGKDNGSKLRLLYDRLVKHHSSNTPVHKLGLCILSERVEAEINWRRDYAEKNKDNATKSSSSYKNLAYEQLYAHIWDSADEIKSKKDEFKRYCRLGKGFRKLEPGIFVPTDRAIILKSESLHCSKYKLIRITDGHV